MAWMEGMDGLHGGQGAGGEEATLAALLASPQAVPVPASGEARHPSPQAVPASRKKLVIVLVGLPARGKSYISHRLVNYLTWIGVRCRLFNVGAFRHALGDALRCPAY